MEDRPSYSVGDVITTSYDRGEDPPEAEDVREVRDWSGAFVFFRYVVTNVEGLRITGKVIEVLL